MSKLQTILSSIAQNFGYDNADPHWRHQNGQKQRRRKYCEQQKQKRTRGKLFRAWRLTRVHIYKSKTLERSTGSSQEPGGGTGTGRGGRSSTMPQCSPSARPWNKAQWLHCQQAFSCTFIGLPDTRPLPVSITSTTTFSGAGATVCSSTAGVKETILRSTAAFWDAFCLSSDFFHSNATTDTL